MIMDTKDIFTKTFQRKVAEKPAITAAPPAPQKAKRKAPPAPERTGETPAIDKSAAGKRAAAAISMFDAENIVRSIHKPKEENQRITVDVPVDIYKSMKLHLAHENVSIRDFVVRLIEVYLTKNEIR